MEMFNFQELLKFMLQLGYKEANFDTEAGHFRVADAGVVVHRKPDAEETISGDEFIAHLNAVPGFRIFMNPGNGVLVEIRSGEILSA